MDRGQKKGGEVVGSKGKETNTHALSPDAEDFHQRCFFHDMDLLICANQKLYNDYKLHAEYLTYQCITENKVDEQAYYVNLIYSH